MKSRCIIFLAGILFIAMFAGIIDARKDRAESWKGVKKDEATSEIIQVPVDTSKVTSIPTNGKDSRDFESRPNIWAYSDIGKEDTSFGKNFESRPNIWAYNDNGKEDTSFGNDFKSRPNIWAYNDNGKEDTSFRKDFKSRPNIWAYNDNGKEDTSFGKDFKSRPNIWAYNDEPRPNNDGEEAKMDAVVKD